MRIIKSLLYYRDIKFLIKIFITSIKISFISLIKGPQSLVDILPPINISALKNADREKINKYVNLYIFICRKIGIRNTCLTRSILLCYILRQSGIDAKVNFGAKKADSQSRTGLNMIGHCWVTVGDEKLQLDEKLIFSYP